MIARALEHRSRRVPAQEPAARRPAAGDRHHPARTRRSSPCSTGSCERMNWSAAVRPRQRRHAARPRHRDRLKACDLADHVGRHRQRRRRRQRHGLLRHGGHGPGLRHRHGADRRRGARRPGRDGEVVHSRHRRHALRHGHARLALAVPHGQRSAARRRGGARQDRSARARGRRARRQQHADRRAVPKKYGMQAGNIIGIGDATCPTICRPTHETGQIAQHDAVLDGRRRGCRGRGRHRDRARARSPSWSTSSTAARRSIRGSSRRRSPAPRSCSSASRCSRRCSSTAGQVTNASLADYKIPGIPRRARGHGERGGRRRCSTTARSAPRASARSATFGVSPAIANAMDDAVGVRLMELPLNPEAVFRALREKAGKPIKET